MSQDVPNIFIFLFLGFLDDKECKMQFTVSDSLDFCQRLAKLHHSFYSLFLSLSQSQS